jgi:hypothetical protein
VKRHFGQQAMGTQQTDAAADTAATAATLDRIVRPGTKQLLRQLTIAKATDSVLAFSVA